ncbi:hypothetical protein IQ06DRAFT_334955 [Phaeosphaeriaceae sp. SRC1lsM3a]|nr:hypothetical protein IQ06DRAFT_334955 [Stagonospora sp. SRC1lsM3a]
MATAGGISMVQCYMFSLDDAQMPQEQTYRHAAATHDSYRPQPYASLTSTPQTSASFLNTQQTLPPPRAQPRILLSRTSRQPTHSSQQNQTLFPHKKKENENLLNNLPHTSLPIIKRTYAPRIRAHRSRLLMYVVTPRDPCLGRIPCALRLGCGSEGGIRAYVDCAWYADARVAGRYGDDFFDGAGGGKGQECDE